MRHTIERRIGERILVGFIKDDCPHIIRTFMVKFPDFGLRQRFEITRYDPKTATRGFVEIERFDEVTEKTEMVTDDIHPDEIIVYLASLIE